MNVSDIPPVTEDDQLNAIDQHIRVRLWKALCENATLAMFIMDEQQQCIYMNPAAENLTGFSLEETRGRALHDVLHHTRPDGSPYPLEECPIDQAFPQNMREQGEEVFVHKDGSFYPVAFTASPLQGDDGTPIGTIIEVRSVAEERAAAARLRETERRLQFALSAGRAIGTWEWDVPNDIMRTDRRFAEMFGVDPDEARVGMSLGPFVEAIHEEDRPRVAAAIEKAVETGEEYEQEYRVTANTGEQVWLLARGRCFRDKDGNPDCFPGAAVDISRQRAQVEHAQLLANELNHRVKNTLQTVQAVAMYSLKREGLDEKLYADFISRIQALSSVHNLLMVGEWKQTEFGEVLKTALLPFGYDDDEANSRFRVAGPSVPVSAQHAQAFSMALHELATNAAKYGALSNESGTVDVSWDYDQESRDFSLTWKERGGPAVEKPTRQGFGTLMLTRILAGDLTGTITITYPEDGALCTVSGKV